MSDRPLKIAVAGIGFGAAVHVPGLRSIPGVEIVAIAASDRARAREAAERLSIPLACGGIRELLDRDLDAVTLALPPDVNEVALDQVLDRHIAVLSEKPLGRNVPVTNRLVERAADRTATIDFEFSELAEFIALKRLVDIGELGAIRQIDVTWVTQSWAQRNQFWNWKSDARHGGGVLALLGAHALYLIEWMFGAIEAIETVRADRTRTRRFTPPGSIAAADDVAFTARLENGIAVRAEFANSRDGAPLHRWSVTGEHGTAVLENASADYMQGFQLRVSGCEPPSLAPPRNAASDGRVAAFASLAQRFAAAARKGEPCQPNFAAGARVQRWMGVIDGASGDG